MTDIAIPPPSGIRAYRAAAGLTQAQAAEVMGYGSVRGWQAIESGERRPSGPAWELWMLKTNQHPTMRLAPRTGAKR